MGGPTTHACIQPRSCGLHCLPSSNCRGQGPPAVCQVCLACAHLWRVPMHVHPCGHCGCVPFRRVGAVPRQVYEQTGYSVRGVIGCSAVRGSARCRCHVAELTWVALGTDATICLAGAVLSLAGVRVRAASAIGDAEAAAQVVAFVADGAVPAIFRAGAVLAGAVLGGPSAALVIGNADAIAQVEPYKCRHSKKWGSFCSMHTRVLFGGGLVVGGGERRRIVDAFTVTQEQSHARVPLQPVLMFSRRHKRSRLRHCMARTHACKYAHTQSAAHTEQLPVAVLKPPAGQQCLCVDPHLHRRWGIVRCLRGRCGARHRSYQGGRSSLHWGYTSCCTDSSLFQGTGLGARKWSAGLMLGIGKAMYSVCMLHAVCYAPKACCDVVRRG